MVKAKRGMAEQSHIPKLHQLNNEYERLIEENKKLTDNKPKDDAGGLFNEKMLKEQLGDRYHELGDMIHKAKEDIIRVNQLAKQAIPLPIKIQHPYTYSKWDSILST